MVSHWASAFYFQSKYSQRWFEPYAYNLFAVIKCFTTSWVRVRQAVSVRRKNVVFAGRNWKGQFDHSAAGPVLIRRQIQIQWQFPAPKDKIEKLRKSHFLLYHFYLFTLSSYATDSQWILRYYDLSIYLFFYYIPVLLSSSFSLFLYLIVGLTTGCHGGWVCFFFLLGKEWPVCKSNI